MRTFLSLHPHAPFLKGRTCLVGRWCLALFVSWLWMSESRAVDEAVALRSVEAVWRVGAWSDLQEHPLSLEGTVTAIDPERRRLVLQDATGALVLQWPDALPEVLPGERIALSAADSEPWRPDLPNYPHHPDRREQLPAFEAESPVTGNYFVARFRGWLHPPVSGLYRLAISSDNSSQLFVGSGPAPGSRRMVGQVLAYTRPRDWTRNPDQISGPLFLEEGRAYYIEVLHQQSGGPQHLSVAWERPGGAFEVVPGSALSPWSDREDLTSPKLGARGWITREVWEGVSVDAPGVLAEASTLNDALAVHQAVVQRRPSRELPSPRARTPGEVLAPEDASLWSSIEGTVVRTSQVDDRCEFDLEADGHRVRVVASEWRWEPLSSLQGRKVRVTGVPQMMFNSSGQRALSGLIMSRASELTLIEAIPAFVDARPASLAELLLMGADEWQGLPVRVSGRVVGRDAGRVIIQDRGAIYASYSENGETWTTAGPPLELDMGPRAYIGFAVNSRAGAETSRARFTVLEGMEGDVIKTDLGGPAAEGHLLREGAVFDVEGVGSEIWNTPDQFTFVHRVLEGEGRLTVKIEAFSPGDRFSKAGIMIRDGLSPDAQFVDLIRWAPSGEVSLALQWRRRVYGVAPRSHEGGLPRGAAPIWLRLERRYTTLPVLIAEDSDVSVGDAVDVVGVPAFEGDRPLLRSAVLAARGPDGVERPEGKDWRPLLPISRLFEGDKPWGGHDYFRLRGVVTFCGEAKGRHYWVVQDASGATLVTGRTPSKHFNVRPGRFVEVVSNPGWAPTTSTLFADNVFVLGDAAYPNPLAHPAEELLPKRGEGAWIQIEGVVRTITATGAVEIKSGGSLFTVAIPNVQPTSVAPLVDAFVRVQGAIVYPSESERLLLVPTLGQIEVQKTGSDDPFARPVLTVADLFAGLPSARPQHRVHLRGRVTYAEGDLTFVQDDTGGIQVELPASQRLALGASVDVVGFPEMQPDRHLVLRHADCRVSNRVEPVEPLIANTVATATDANLGRLVQVRGSLEVAPSSLRGIRILADEVGVIGVDSSSMQLRLAELPAGTLVDVTGIALRRETGAYGTSLLTRGPEDLRVLKKPSWWVLQRALLLVAGLALLGLGAAFWIHLLRRRVAQRTRELQATMQKLEKEVTRSATLAERDRLAGEIHDSLEQGLNGLIFQIESTASETNCPPSIKEGLDLARNMASFSRTEVQFAVWELQSPLLEDSDLPAAIEKVMRQITSGALQGSVRVEGELRRLPSGLEHHLLRMAQEAINNTVKHAGASRIDVLLVYSPTELRMEVRDDGQGFDPRNIPAGGLGHFGLKSLRSRAGRLRGEFEIRSRNGEGTIICVRVPLSVP